MTLESLTDLLIEELRDLYDAEQQLCEALPKMAEAAFSEELRDAFQLHLKETEEQARRLETIFAKFKLPPQGKRCRAMQGLIEEAEELLAQSDEADPTVLDVGLITAAQKVEHYEIAGYGCVRTYARLLGATDAEKLLQETLDEEAETDRKLTALAESTINLDAAEADQEIMTEVEDDSAGTRGS